MNQSNPSRGDFLRRSAAGGAAALASLNVARSAHASSGGPLKVALIGCGGRGAGAATNLLTVAGEDVKLVAMADVFEDHLHGTLKRLTAGAAKRYDAPAHQGFAKQIDVPPERQFVGLDAYQKAIACADMVILTTPPGFRPSHYAAAVAAGKHVFMEKPCCVDAPGFRLLLATNKLADEKGLKVGVGLQRRHQAGYLAGVKEIQDGKLGDVVFTRVYWDGSPVWFRDREAGESEMHYQMRNWYHFVWLSGDNICEQHVHNLDVGNWIKGDHPVEANGMGYCVERYLGRDPKNGMGQIFDSHFVEFTYPDGSKMFSQCRQIANTFTSVSEAVHGTKGSGAAGSGRGPALKYRDPYEQEHFDLLSAIRNNGKYNEGWYGATSSFTAVLGRMATYSGKVVKWDDAVAQGPSEFPEKLAWNALPRALPDANGYYRIPVPGAYKPY
jgi:predicted dehydrogenase